MTTRGLRLNNPGNIRLGDHWQGEADIQNDPDFITFATPEYGIRAMAKILVTYATKYKINTITDMVKRYAPPSENDTGAYIKDVCLVSGYDADEKIDFTDQAVLCNVLPAIIHHEEGSQPYSKSQISAGVALAV